MTRKRHVFDSPRVVAPSPPPVGPPTVTFQTFSLIAFVGDNVQMNIFWESISAGLATLTTTVPTLSGESDLTLSSGNALWSKTNVQLSDSGQVQVDISDAGGSALDAFTLAVHAVPTISVATTPDVFVDVGQTGLNSIVWGDDDASAQKPIASITTNTGSVDTISDQTQTTGTARWILPNAQINDAHIVTIWITDFDGYVTSVQFQFNVAPAAGAAPVVTVSPFPQELPIGSEAILNFQVQSSVTSLAKPMALFQVLDGVTDVSADGFFSPLPAQVTVPTQVSVGWSTTSSNLVDDGTIYTVRATDDDAGEGEGATELVFNTVDPLKTLSGHPVQRQSGWSASVAPIAATANDPLRQLTGHPNPGVSIWTNPSNVTWANGGVLLDAEVGKMSTSMTASVTTAGTYTARLRVDLPDFDTTVHIRLIKNGTSNDYSHTGPTNLPAGSQLNIETFPVVLVAGDTLTLELWTEHYNGSTIISNPSDAQKAFLSIMDLGTGSASEFPAGGGTVLWDWEADSRTGRFTGPDQATYNAVYNAIPLDPGGTGRPKPTNQYVGASVGVGVIEHPINFEVPTMLADGTCRTFRENPNHDGHCMWRFRMPGGSTQYVKSSSYLHYDETYQAEMKFDLVGRVDAIGEARLMAWGIVWQLHPGSFPGTWSKINPIISFQIDDSTPEHIYRLHVRGCSSFDAAAAGGYDSELSFDVPFWSGPQHFVMDYRPAWSGVGAFLKLWLNGRKVVDVANVPIGLNHSGFGANVDVAQITVGSYGWGLKQGDPAQWLIDGRPNMNTYKLKLTGM